MNSPVPPSSTVTHKTPKSALVIPAGKHQIPLMKRLKSHGYSVHCADRDVNCLGQCFADHFHPIGLSEPDKLLSLCQSIKPDAILTDQTDSGVTVASWLRAQMELPGIGVELAQLFTNKEKMRKHLVAHGFPAPKFHASDDKELLRLAAEKIGTPLILKPATAQSSKGVKIVERLEEFDAAFEQAKGFSSNGIIIAEQYLGGIDLSVEGFSDASEHHTLAIAIKTQFERNPTVIESLNYSPSHEQIDFEKLATCHNALIQSTTLTRSMTHAEYKYYKGDYYLIEFAARGGGSGIASDIVPWVSGVDYLDLMVRHHLEDGPIEPLISAPKGVALLEFLDLPEGRIKKISGVDEARKIEGVAVLELSVSEGDTVPALVNGTDRSGRYILQANNGAALAQIKSKLLETLKIDICLHNVQLRAET